MVGGMKYAGVERASCSPQAGSKSVKAKNIKPKWAVREEWDLSLDCQLLDNFFGYDFFFNDLFKTFIFLNGRWRRLIA